MHRRFPLVALMGMILLLAGCVSTRKVSADRVWVTDAVAVPLVPAGGMEGTFAGFQAMEGSYGERSFALTTYTEAGPQGVSMTFMTTMGQTIASLDYRDGVVSGTASLPGVPFPGSYVVFDFQLCFYRVDDLAAALAPYGLSFTEDAAGVRHLSQEGGDIVTITKEAGAVELVNHLRGYRYRVEAIDG